jgi:sugar phosphate isomerase/epimerase
VAINETKRARLGVLEGGWWEYVIPGTGVIPWGPWVRALQAIGYTGVLSIEHEDRAYPAEEGFALGLRHLAHYVGQAAKPQKTQVQGTAHG